MTIQWTLIASFLYLELGIIFLLVLPFISARIWKCIFRFHLWEAIGRKANTYFMIFLMALVLFLLDSIREMVKYTGKHPHEFEAELQMNMKLYRSQRNYYIAGMALFLSLVIHRLTILILKEYDYSIQNEEASEKAQKATEVLERLMKEDATVEEPKSLPKEKFTEEIRELENLLKRRDDELQSARQNLGELKAKSADISEQYKELLAQVNILKGDL